MSDEAPVSDQGPQNPRRQYRWASSRGATVTAEEREATRLLRIDHLVRAAGGDLFSRRASLDYFLEVLERGLDHRPGGALLSPEEEKEAGEIMARIDRELPEEEARVNALLRHYGLKPAA